jgi:hypothetical protein
VGIFAKSASSIERRLPPTFLGDENVCAIFREANKNSAISFRSRRSRNRMRFKLEAGVGATAGACKGAALGG